METEDISEPKTDIVEKLNALNKTNVPFCYLNSILTYNLTFSDYERGRK